MNATESKPNDKKLPVPGEVFLLENHIAFLILPDNCDTYISIPWVWYAPTLGNYPGPEEQWMFEQFLVAGIAIAGIDVGESYGSPAGRKIFSKLYEELTHNRGCSEKASLLARSRGGLMLYNWAAENAARVQCIAGIYPVCNIASYPGPDKACTAYDMTAEELSENLDTHNPIDRLKPLADACVPIFHIHGDNDEVVPLEDNSALLAARYKNLGGDITLEIVPRGGHDMSTCWFKSQNLVDFVIGRNA